MWRRSPTSPTAEGRSYPQSRLHPPADPNGVARDTSLSGPARTVGGMTNTDPHFVMNRPGALIAALPAVLGFVPEKSLVIISLHRGEMGAVMRADLSDVLADDDLSGLAQVVAGPCPDAAIAVVVDADGTHCPKCNQQYRDLSEDLDAALAEEYIRLIAVHVVDRVGAGGRWHCVDGCDAHGPVDDPVESPLAVAAVVDGRRLYDSRADLQTVIAAVDLDGAAEVAELIAGLAEVGCAERVTDSDACTRRGVRAAMAAVGRVAAGETLRNDEVADLAYILTDVLARDTLYALAVGEQAEQAEILWTVLSRRVPSPWRVEPLVLLAFSAYSRGDGPLAGISLDEALRCNPKHRMATMLDQALQSGMRPEQIRTLARTGYRLAERLGVQLPARRPQRRKAG